MIDVGCDREVAEICASDDRRALLRASRTLGGIDYVEVYPDGVTLCVHMFGTPPRDLTLRNVVIEGGTRIKDVAPVDVSLHEHDDGDLCLQVRLNKTGDFSRYCVCLAAADETEVHCSFEAVSAVRRKSAPGVDPRFACGEFWFRREGPTAADCLPSACPPADKGVLPAINYLSRDYQSIRGLIFDRLAQTAPGWRERLAPDLGVAIVEVLAYVADQLSYKLDAVATEAFLRTARQRISVRRHVRIVDYRMHEGCNARTWVTIGTDADSADYRLGDFLFAASPDGVASQIDGFVAFSELKTSGAILFEAAWWRGSTDRNVIVELTAAHTAIQFYTWSRRECCLPAGSTRATLLDETPLLSRGRASNPFANHKTSPKSEKNSDPDNRSPRLLRLKVDDVLMFEETRGCATGSPADADPARRHAVRLTRVHPTEDPLTGTKIIEIEWGHDDALPFDLRLSVRTAAPDCEVVTAAVARGNVILVDHGVTVADPGDWSVLVDETHECCVCDGASTIVVKTPTPLTFTLGVGPITHAERLPNGKTSARALLAQIRATQRPACGFKLRELRVELEARARQIVFRALDPNDPDADKQAQTKANATLARIKNGEDFATLAKELTDDTAGKRDGGDLGYFTKDDVIPALAEIVFGLKKGQTSDPKKIASDWRIVKIEDQRERREDWRPVRDLLASGPEDRDFVVEIDDEAQAHVRFGDGVYGRRPSVGWRFNAECRVGNGPAGNVGHDAIRLFSLRSGARPSARWTVRSPLAATGGATAEPIDDAKAYAPHAYGRILERAVAAADYAQIAAADERVQGACAELAWTGSLYEAAVAIDPLAQADTSEIEESARTRLERARRIGHDVRLVSAKRVALDIALCIHAAPHALRGDIEHEARDILSNRVLSDGRRGLFYPDEWKFGEDVSGSRVISALQAVDGVEWVQLTRFARLFGDNASAQKTLENFLIPIASDEVAILDADPNFPEHGVLTLTLRGGR